MHPLVHPPSIQIDIDILIYLNYLCLNNSMIGASWGEVGAGDAGVANSREDAGKVRFYILVVTN